MWRAALRDWAEDTANAEWAIVGSPETRDVDPKPCYFRRSELRRTLKRCACSGQPRQIRPHLDYERFLTALLLRRYVMYCARRQRYAQMPRRRMLYENEPCICLTQMASSLNRDCHPTGPYSSPTSVARSMPTVIKALLKLAEHCQAWAWARLRY